VCCDFVVDMKVSLPLYIIIFYFKIHVGSVLKAKGFGRRYTLPRKFECESHFEVHSSSSIGLLLRHFVQKC